MEIKILQVFYDKNGLPYKDKERAVHYPTTSGTFLGSSNTTQIRFYYDKLDELNESTFVAVSKLPNGRIGSEILESEYDSELEENYAVLNLSQFYTQYKGDVYISLQGYEGGVRVEQDENGIYSILGTPTIAATGSIRMYVAYAPTFIGSGQTENVTLQRVLAELSTKLGIRQETLHVEELPTVGNPNVWYVVNDDPNDTTKANIYIWNAKTQTYVWVGDNTLDLGDYYTQEQGEQFENGIDNRVTSVENELSSVASGSPKGVYATLADLQTAYPTGAEGIYVVSADGHWYYWNGSAWTDGGVYQATSQEIILEKSLSHKIDNVFELENQSITINDNSLILTNGQVYTGSSYASFKTIGPETVSVGDIYEVTGFCSKGDEIPLCLFKNDDDAVISYIISEETGIIDYNTPIEVVIPYGATKMYINTRNATQRKLLKKVFSNELNGNYIVETLNKKIEKLSKLTQIGTYVWGKWWQTNGTEYDVSYGCYCYADVNDGDKLIIGGIFVNSSFVLWEIRDENNNLVSRSSTSGTQWQYQDNVEVIVPAGGARIYVNGRINTSNSIQYPTIQKQSIYSPDLEEINNKLTKQVKWKSVGTAEDGKFVVVGGTDGKTKVSTFSSYNYVVIEYDKTKKYRFTACCRANNIPCLSFTDENDYTISVYGDTTDDFIQEYESITIPAGTKKIYANGYSSVKALIEVAEEKEIEENPFKDKVGICFGDSIMQGVGGLPSYNPTFPNYKPNGCDAPYWLGKTLGCTIYNGGLGGGTASGSRSIDFKNVADCIESGNFSTILSGITEYELNGFATYWYNKIKDLDFSKVDFILIAYGFNDWNFGAGETAYKNGLIYGIEKILTNYPNIQVYIATPGYFKGDRGGVIVDSDLDANSTSGLYLYQFVQYTKDIAHTYKIPCYDLYYEGGLNSINIATFMNGVPHRNKLGYKLLGEQYAKFIGSK